MIRKIETEIECLYRDGEIWTICMVREKTGRKGERRRGKEIE